MQEQAGSASTETSIPKEWNDTAREYPRDACVHELFEAQAQRRSESVALAFEEQTLTYAELNERSNQLARHLRQCGVGPDVLVGLCMERSIDMVVGLMGILKAGGAYVPLDPAYPRDRIAYIMEDASAPVLVTQESLLTSLPEQQTEVVLIDEHWPSISQEDDTNLGRTAEAGNLAYVIYTSGSTGQPKGVQLEHRSVVNFLCSMKEEPGLQQSDVVAAVTTLCFDIAGLEIYLPLVTGATVVVVSREEAADGKKLQTRLRESGVTAMQATPATWRLLLEAGWPGDRRLKILCGGEAFPRELANKLLPRCRSLWNMYGPTETTIWSAVYQVVEGDEATVPIGHAIANTQFYIVGEDLTQVPPGEVGQLLIGGEGLARGYKNRPDLTQEKFIADRFGGIPGARLYQTGDLARYLADGTIAFLGRIDHQVKIRGYRIELGEIESVLATHPSVRQCAVVAREDGGEKRLVAYLVPDRNQQPLGRTLREFLRTKLPDYMMPAAFVVVNALPLTPNGKIDRKALPVPTRENSAIERALVPPRDELERELTAIWESVLRISPIGITDNIFDLGVDSLLAAELFARIEKTLGKNLPPAPLFQAPTVETLAVLLRRGDPQQKWTSLVSIQPRGSRKPLFCVHGGAGTVLLFNTLARHLAPERPVYGLQARGLYGRGLPHTTVEDMAAHYVAEIRSLQPHGPYLLGGWCFGGIVAYEIAHQLQRKGEQLELLVMFNAPSSPDYYSVKVNAIPDDPVPPPGGRMRARWREFWALGTHEKMQYVGRRIRGRLRNNKRKLYRHLRGITRRSLCRLYIALRLPLPDHVRNYYFLYTSTIAENRYRPKPYSGSMLIFRDQGPYQDPNLGWSQFVTGDIEAHEVPVSVNHHRALMQEPVARTVAEKLEEYLARKSGALSSASANSVEELVGSGQSTESNVVQ
jgi:amino acid adenylation domain-containing protein